MAEMIRSAEAENSTVSLAFIEVNGRYIKNLADALKASRMSSFYGRAIEVKESMSVAGLLIFIPSGRLVDLKEEGK